MTKPQGGDLQMEAPMIVSYGAGVNSTAMLCGFAERGVVPAAILFADTGAEKPDTYAFLDIMDRWLADHAMPTITRLRYAPTRPGVVVWTSLEQECVERAQLPSLAYGWHKCSEKWKVRPQVRWLAENADLQAYIAAGNLVRKAIGFRVGEERRRKEHIQDPGTVKVFPLQEWGWEQEDCIAAIHRAGLPTPPKSACFFCPASTAENVVDLHRRYPELAQRAIALEDRAREAGNLRTVEGLGRHWTWRQVIEFEDRKQYLFDDIETLAKVENVRSLPRPYLIPNRTVAPLGEIQLPRQDAEVCVQPKPRLCDLFRDPMDEPCGCYDGDSDD